MENLIKNYLFAFVTGVNLIIHLIMLIFSLLVNQEWYVSAMMLISSMIAAGFFYFSYSWEESKVKECFIFIFYVILLPVSHLLYGERLSEFPMYFVFGIMFTAILIKGRPKILLLILQVCMDLVVLTGSYLLSERAVVTKIDEMFPIYCIRLLFAIIFTAAVGGIVMRYRNLFLLDHIKEGERWEAMTEEADHFGELFLLNVSHEIHKSLAQIQESAQMLLDAGSDVQRAEDIFFLDHTAERLKIAVQELLDGIEYRMESEEEQGRDRETYYRGILCKMQDIIDFSAQKTYHAPMKMLCPQACILAVDDHAINLEIVINMLEQYQCRIIGAQSGAECVELLQKQKVDMIFLDYMMPQMDGVETLNKIRDLPSGNKVPVIVLTADVQSGARETFIKAGFDDYMKKPVETKILYEMLKKYLNPDLIIEVNE